MSRTLLLLSLVTLACSHRASCSADADFSTSDSALDPDENQETDGDQAQASEGRGTAGRDGFPAAVPKSKQKDWPTTRLEGPLRRGARGLQVLLGPQQVPVLLHPSPSELQAGSRARVEGRLLPAVPPAGNLGPGGASGISAARWLLSQPNRVEDGAPRTVPSILPIAVVAEAWPELEPCLRSAHDDLGEELGRFWVDLDWKKEQRTLVIPLWHEKTIRQSPTMTGDAAQKSRNAICNLETGEIDSYQFWQ